MGIVNVPVPVPGTPQRAGRVGRWAVMELDHERLDVYHLALDFLVMANSIIEALPRGRSHLADQFPRSSTSIVLNVAEGAGKLSKPDKRRYYLTARGSATESAALLDVCLRLELLDQARHQAGQGDNCAHRVDTAPARPSLRSVASPIRSPRTAQPTWEHHPRRARARA